MVKYNFDEIIERRNTDCLKWDSVEERWHKKNLLPMWVADMDFRTPPFLMDALNKRNEHEGIQQCIGDQIFMKTIGMIDPWFNDHLKQE